MRGRSDDATPRRRCAASSGSRPGCGATPSCSTSSAGCASTTTGPARTRGQAGFYGLDLYSLYRSIDEVIAYLERVDPPAAARARERYACFDHFGEDAQDYGYAAAFGARRLLRAARSSTSSSTCSAAGDYAAPRRPRRRGRAVLRRAERPTGHRRGGVLPHHVRRARLVVEPARPAHGRHARRPARPPRPARGEPAKIVVWAHNSHLGDARATEMAPRASSTSASWRANGTAATAGSSASPPISGTVTAADDWGGAGRTQAGRPALRDSYEACSTTSATRRSCSRAQRRPTAAALLRTRAWNGRSGSSTGPETERQSHYFRARLPTSSTRSSISTRPGRSNRSNRRPVGSEARCPRPIRRRLSDRSSG